MSHVSAAQHWALPLPPAMVRDPVHLAVPWGTERVRARGLLTHELRLEPHDVLVDGPLRTTTPTRTLLDLAGWLSLADLVAAVDAGLRAGTAGRELLTQELASGRSHRGIRRFRQAVALADPGAESPQESRLRVVLVCSGLPAPECNVDVFDDAGVWLGRVDLLLRGHRVVIEYDGVVHLDDEQRKRDLRRRNALTEAGFLVLTFAADSWSSPATMATQVADVLRSRGWAGRLKPLESPVLVHPRRPR